MDFLSFLKAQGIFKKQVHLFGSIAIAIALVGLLLGFQLWTIGVGKINQLNQQVAIEKKKNDLLAGIQNLHGHLQKYQEKLPLSMDTAWLIQKVTELVQREGLPLLFIHPEKTLPSLQFNSSAVRFGLECGYHQLGRLIAQFENSPVFLKIQELSIEKVISDLEGSRGIGHVEIVVSIFTLPGHKVE